MNAEPEGNENPFFPNPDSDRGSRKNFFKSKSAVLIAVIGAAIFIIVGVGPVRSSTGNFLASALDIVRRTFSSGEILVGEIPLSHSVNPAPEKSSATAAPKDRSVKVSSPGKTVQTDSKDKQIAALNDKINVLQSQLNAASLAVPSLMPTSSKLTMSDIVNFGTGKVLISEIMAGADGNSNYEFIEIYNAGSAPVDLTGWSIKKKSSSGNESSLVTTSRFSGKIIQPGKYFLLGNENGYKGSASLDVAWPSSYTLAYTNNSVVLYNGSGSKVEEIFWAEIPKGQSFARNSWDGSQFTLSNFPTPKNSQGQ